MFSTAVIEKALQVLVIDTTNNQEGWEWGLTARLISALGKRGLSFASTSPIRVNDLQDVYEYDGSIKASSCIVILGGSGSNAGICLDVWDWLGSHVEHQILTVVCKWGELDQALTTTVLGSNPIWSPMALAQESEVSPRSGALFLLKFLVELDLHSDDRITGRMAWFAWRKAAELLKRRGLTTVFGLRS